MELRQLRYVVAVAEERHFGRAAERLHIGQPAVSQQIRRLERELGVELFDRSPRHVRLTEAGSQFLPAAREVLAAADRARDVVGGSPSVRLGTGTGLGVHLERVLAGLRERSPELAVELVSAATRIRLDGVASGRLDATFLRGQLLRQELRAVPVWEDPLLVALPATHPLAAAPEVALADLADIPLLLTPRRTNPPLVDLIDAACREAGFVPTPGPTSGTLADSIAAIGAGPPLWTVVYAAHADTLAPGRVVFRPSRPALSMPTSLVVRRAAPTPHLDTLLRACTIDFRDRSRS